MLYVYIHACQLQCFIYLYTDTSAPFEYYHIAQITIISFDDGLI